MDDNGSCGVLALKIQAYLEIWAPWLCTDVELCEELLAEAMEALEKGAKKDAVHDAIHGYFVSWCAVDGAGLSADGGAAIQRSRPGRIWGEVQRGDVFAASEFGDLPNPQASLLAWFDSRLDEAKAILELRLGEVQGFEAFGLFCDWLQGIEEDDLAVAADKRRRIVKIVLILRKEFGTINQKPKPLMRQKLPSLLERLAPEVRTKAEAARETARNALLKLQR